MNNQILYTHKQDSKQIEQGMRCRGHLDIGKLDFIWRLGFGYWNLIFLKGGAYDRI